MIDRTAAHSPTQSTVTTLEPLLVDLHACARLLGCSSRHVEDLHREGLMPAARRLGRLLRWDVAELREWVKSGCPNRVAWEMKKAADSAKSDGHIRNGQVK